MKKLTKYEIRSLLFAPIWFYLPLFGHTEEDTEYVVTNAVVLVFGECQIVIETYLRGYLPSYKVALHCIVN